MFGIKPFDIYLPDKSIDLSKWSVVACDQYTSQKEYWDDVMAIVGNSPSTLHLIQPEAFLNNLDTDKINKTMADYIEDGVLKEVARNSFLLIERKIGNKKRVGLVVALDLEEYNLPSESPRLARPTEDIVTERLPARISIRQNSLIETSHVMVLINDERKSLIEEIYNSKKNELLFDVTLMKEGGKVRGWAIPFNTYGPFILQKLNELNALCDGFLYAVGDGNHSLASAKIYWDRIKSNLSPNELKNNPFRYYMVELVNLFSDSISFEPIHRIVFKAQEEDIIRELSLFLKTINRKLICGNGFIISDGHNSQSFSIEGCEAGNELPLLQPFLDYYIKKNKFTIDYIHGADSLSFLLKNNDGVGFYLKSIRKDSFFSLIAASGVLPRKAFSIGESNEKKYYLECRLLFETKI